MHYFTPFFKNTFYYIFTQNHIDPLFRTVSRGSRVPRGGSRVPQGPFSEGLRKYEEVGEGVRRSEKVRGSQRKLEKVGESWRKYEEVRESLGGTILDFLRVRKTRSAASPWHSRRPRRPEARRSASSTTCRTPPKEHLFTLVHAPRALPKKPLLSS